MHQPSGSHIACSSQFRQVMGQMGPYDQGPRRCCWSDCCNRWASWAARASENLLAWLCCWMRRRWNQIDSAHPRSSKVVAQSANAYVKALAPQGLHALLLWLLFHCGTSLCGTLQLGCSAMFHILDQAKQPNCGAIFEFYTIFWFAITSCYQTCTAQKNRQDRWALLLHGHPSCRVITPTYYRLKESKCYAVPCKAASIGSSTESDLSCSQILYSIESFACRGRHHQLYPTKLNDHDNADAW